MKNLYLTIDDAPSSDLKNKISYLSSVNISAVIFCIGQQMLSHEEDLIEAIDRGFIIGNHSLTHVQFSQIDLAKAEEEIRKTDSIIEQLYAQAGKDRPRKLFRFPYGDRGGENEQSIQQILKEYGYEASVYPGVSYDFYEKHTKEKALDTWWTFNVMEYQFRTPDDLNRRLKARNWPLGVNIPQVGGCLASRSAEVVVIHDHAETGHLFRSIIQELTRSAAFKPV